MRRIASLLLVVGLLAGCASTPVELAPDVALDLQNAVVAVAEPAADGDLTTSLERLDAVQEQLDAAISTGDVSAQRAALIQSAIDAVRADLELALTPEPEPTPEPVEPEKPGKGNKPEKPGKDK